MLFTAGLFLLLALPGLLMTLPAVLALSVIKHPLAMVAALSWPIIYGWAINFDHEHNWPTLTFPWPYLNFASAPWPWLGAIPSFAIAAVLAVRNLRTI